MNLDFSLANGILFLVGNAGLLRVSNSREAVIQKWMMVQEPGAYHPSLLYP